MSKIFHARDVAIQKDSGIYDNPSHGFHIQQSKFGVLDESENAVYIDAYALCLTTKMDDTLGFVGEVDYGIDKARYSPAEVVYYVNFMLWRTSQHFLNGDEEGEEGIIT